MRPSPLRPPTLLAALATAAACRGPAPLPPPSPLAMSLAPPGGEVWAWHVEVRGEAPVELASCRAVVEAEVVPLPVRGRTYRGRLPLAPGRNLTTVACDGAAGERLLSPPAIFLARLRDAPTARVRAAAAQGALELDASPSTPAEVAPAALVEHTWTASPLRSEGAARPPRVLGEGARLRVSPEALGAGAHAVRVRVRDARGRVDEGGVVVDVDGGVARVLDRDGERRPWMEGAIVYGAVPHLYGTPPLAALRGALTDIAAVGATVVWLAPVFDAPLGDYGYAVTDYFRVRPEYGTAEDLRDLVAEAHRLGLRVVLDLVPNHTSALHRYFVEAQEIGRRSHTFAFYERTPEGAPTHYFDWVNLPNLDYDNPEVGRFMTAASTHWLRAVGADGFRVDAAWGIQRRTPAFYRAWVAEVSRVRPGALLLAEASARDPFWREQGFDAAYDWTEELGRPAWEHVFDVPDEAPERLHEALTRGGTPSSRVVRFLDNNDTGPRFVTRHGVPMTKVATAALFTVPGIPALFTGSERGAAYEPYVNRSPLVDRAPSELPAWHAKLAALRRSLPSLRSGSFERAPARGATGVYAFLRQRDASAALVVLHFGGASAQVEIDVPGALGRTALELEDALAGGAARIERGRVRLRLEPWSARVLVSGPPGATPPVELAR